MIDDLFTPLMNNLSKVLAFLSCTKAIAQRMKQRKCTINAAMGNAYLATTNPGVIDNIASANNLKNKMISIGAMTDSARYFLSLIN